MERILVKDDKVKKLKACVREFKYFLDFLGIKKNVEIFLFDGEYYVEVNELARMINFAFFGMSREDKMLRLIEMFFNDPLFVKYVYLKLYLRRQDQYVKQKLCLSDQQLQFLKQKFLSKNFKIELR